ncbi:ortholog of Bordetella pertussis (BX470248) BP3468 [plant metagenome]|uniref:Ortholog of Bordetella pertussis (BX470248) BP3468 n=1 Tax=plant metagenome TaxID=1297885 RepID=A0A484RA91_9ZZZZ
MLRAPGMLRLDIPLDVIEDDDSVRRVARVADQDVDVVDEGDLAAAWFSNVAGQPCRLVKLHPDAAPVAWPAG